MKTVNYLIIAVIGIFTLNSFTNNNKQGEEKDYNACIKKAKSEWGAVCADCIEYKDNKRVYDDTYTVYLTNTCTETLDIKWTVQEADKTWRSFPARVIAPNDTVSGYACSGTGKYMYWVKKAGDTSVDFPTDAQINEAYGPKEGE